MNKNINFGKAFVAFTILSIVFLSTDLRAQNNTERVIQRKDFRVGMDAATSILAINSSGTGNTFDKIKFKTEDFNNNTSRTGYVSSIRKVIMNTVDQNNKKSDFHTFNQAIINQGGEYPLSESSEMVFNGIKEFLNSPNNRTGIKSDPDVIINAGISGEKGLFRIKLGQNIDDSWINDATKVPIPNFGIEVGSVPIITQKGDYLITANHRGIDKSKGVIDAVVLRFPNKAYFKVESLDKVTAIISGNNKHIEYKTITISNPNVDSKRNFVLQNDELWDALESLMSDEDFNKEAAYKINRRGEVYSVSQSGDIYRVRTFNP